MLGPICSYAQENELEVADSAEVFLEDYSDEFQEVFFEALKQKGIENYDRAINLFLECKRLQAHNVVIDHELAKAYLASEQLPLAQEYAMAALRSLPENYWVLNSLVTIMERQGMDLDFERNHIPSKNVKLRENLTLIYYRQGNYKNALKILDGMKESDFTRELTFKIKDSLKDKNAISLEKELKPIQEEREANPITDYISLISGLMEAGNFKEMEIQGLEAMERFPTHPYFYYAYGTALNKKGRYKQAITIMESGLDFLLDDVGLANKIYRELADANKALGNSSKANMYLSKIKPGL
ncbi:MAG TPA: tetratricopeptide repeat protein [Arenibacter sp.]|nr:tetratricopeptide repeat protein [Arenibacter sp.]